MKENIDTAPGALQSPAMLAAAIAGRLAAMPVWSCPPSTLYSPCSYFLGLGGKRVRPVLCLMSAELFGAIPEDAWHAALAVELFHNFTLVHDDIMDNAPLRRGQATLHEKYGLTAGILCGDILNIAAYDELAKVKTALPALLALFNTTAREVCEGQQMDMDFQSAEAVTLNDYIRMITLKTSVLLAASLKMGALVSGASVGNAAKLYEFGLSLGIAFQLMDDFLDAFGDAAKLGKQPGGDIIEGKQTYLSLYTLQRHGDTLRAAQAIQVPDEKVSAVRGVFRQAGADVACRSAMDEYAAKAIKALDEVAIQESRKVALRNLAAELLQREF